MLGIGVAKRESLIITAFLVFGLIGGSIVLLIAVWPIGWCVRNFTRSKLYLLFSLVQLHIA